MTSNQIATIKNIIHIISLLFGLIFFIKLNLSAFYEYSTIIIALTVFCLSSICSYFITKKKIALSFAFFFFISAIASICIHHYKTEVPPPVKDETIELKKFQTNLNRFTRSKSDTKLRSILEAKCTQNAEVKIHIGKGLFERKLFKLFLSELFVSPITNDSFSIINTRQNTNEKKYDFIELSQVKVE